MCAGNRALPAQWRQAGLLSIVSFKTRGGHRESPWSALSCPEHFHSPPAVPPAPPSPRTPFPLPPPALSNNGLWLPVGNRSLKTHSEDRSLGGTWGLLFFSLLWLTGFSLLCNLSLNHRMRMASYPVCLLPALFCSGISCSDGRAMLDPQAPRSVLMWARDAKSPVWPVRTW